MAEFGRVVEGLVCSRVNAHFGELLLKVGVPMILDLIVCSFWQLLCYHRPSKCMHLEHSTYTNKLCLGTIILS